MEWQPINTAPKGGSTILLSRGAQVTVGGWITDIDHGADYEGQLNCAGWWLLEGDWTPTHWMPLPEGVHRHFSECPVAIAVDTHQGNDAICEATCTCKRNQFPQR